MHEFCKNEIYEFHNKRWLSIKCYAFFLFTLAAFTPVLGVFSHTSLQQQQQQKTEKVKKPNITRRGRVQEFL